MQSQPHFDRGLLPPARTFYEAELGRLSRPSHGWARGNCPFHKSKSKTSFSVNLEHGGCFCHGCGVRGDIIGFVMLRDGCGFKSACQALGIWRENISAEEHVAIVRRQQERAWHQQREMERIEAHRRARIDARHRLHATIRIYRAADDKLHRLGPVAAAEPYWAVLPPTLDVWRMEESEYCLAAGLDNPYE